MGARKDAPRERVIVALERLGIEYTDTGSGSLRRLYVRKGQEEEIYSDAKRFCGAYKVKPFLDSVLNSFEKAAGK